jgi:anti-sigma28 factor (negative regulator of flagellin synthesis)
MHINRPGHGFLAPEARANRTAISEYSSTGTTSTVPTSSRKVPDDVASTSQIAMLTGALKGVATASELRVEQLRLAYVAGDYPLDLNSLAGNLAERLLSDQG